MDTFLKKWYNNTHIHFNLGGHPSKVTILARGSGATLVTALTASPKAKDLFQQVWVTNGAGVFQNKSLEMANTENKVKEGRIDTLLFSTLNFFTSKIDLWLFFISVGSMTCEMWSKKNKNELFGSVLLITQRNCKTIATRIYELATKATSPQ